MTGADQLATVELEPLDAGRLRDWRATEAIETFRGKVNRMSIGLPRWRLGADARTCIPDQTRDRFSALPGAAAMTLDLTLLPDTGCRFASAELALELDGAPSAGEAVVAWLEPHELSDQAVVVRETSGALKASLGASLSPVVDAEVGRSGLARDEVTRMLVRLAAFGTGTPQAGWRLMLTDAREIPFNTTDLTALIAHPAGWTGSVRFSVLAQIQVRSLTDRWLTAAFGMRDLERLECSQAFPP
jgi:hypothetical protein